MVLVQVQYLGLAPDTILKFYTGLKPRVRKFWGLTLKFAEVTEEKWVEGRGRGGASTPILYRVKFQNTEFTTTATRFTSTYTLGGLLLQGAHLCTWLVTRLKSETFGKLLTTKLRSVDLYGRDWHSSFEPVIRAYFKLILYLLVAWFEKLKYFKSKVLVLSFFQTSLTVIRLTILRIL